MTVRLFDKRMFYFPWPSMMAVTGKNTLVKSLCLYGNLPKVFLQVMNAW